MSTSPLKVVPITDLYSDEGCEGINTEGNYSPYDDETFSPEQHLLIRVVFDAADDCRKLFSKDVERALTEQEIINAASASRFLLSDIGRAYITACGFREKGLAALKNLASRTLSLVGLEPRDVFRNSQEAWEQSVNNGKWPKNFDRSKITKKTTQGILRLFLETDQLVAPPKKRSKSKAPADRRRREVMPEKLAA